MRMGPVYAKGLALKSFRVAATIADARDYGDSPWSLR